MEKPETTVPKITDAPDNTEISENTEILENSEESEATESPEPEQDLNQLIAEAEQRGYLRGLNEKLSGQLHQPALYADLAREKTDRPAEDTADCDSLTSRFLSNIRPGVWD